MWKEKGSLWRTCLQAALMIMAEDDMLRPCPHVGPGLAQQTTVVLGLYAAPRVVFALNYLPHVIKVV